MSKLSQNAVVLGESGTPANNLCIRANLDGTFTIARGNLGATTQDLLTFDADGNAVVVNTLKARGACKGWAKLQMNGAAAPTILAAFNVTAVGRAGTGNFTATLPSGTLSSLHSVTHALPTQRGIVPYGVSPLSTNVVQFGFYDPANGNAYDPVGGSFATITIFGD